LLFVKLTVVDFLLFRALINVAKDYGRLLLITMFFIHQMPDGATLFCIINVYRLCCHVESLMALFSAKKVIRAALLKLLAEMRGPV